MNKPTFGSLFAGIGGFDLGLERVGWECKWQVEIDKQCIAILEKHWPHVKRYRDIITTYAKLSPVDLIAGGDPCPKHSKARGGRRTTTPDLSGYFLAVVGRLCPRWVVRENVPSSTVKHFAAALEALEYGTTIVGMDASMVTGQSRAREFIVGRYKTNRNGLVKSLRLIPKNSGIATSAFAYRKVMAALCAHKGGSHTRDNLIYESGRLRKLDAEEREKLAGFPCRWTFGLSETARARMYGNSVVPKIAEWLGRRIIDAYE